MSEEDKILSFVDKAEAIAKVIESKRGFWKLNSLAYISYDDVAQIILHHIYKKFDQWDQTRPIENWVATIANNKIINLIRDHYGRVAPPCNDCPFNAGGNLCSFTKSGVRSSECQSYRKWEKKKKNGYEMKLATCLDEAPQIAGDISFNFERGIEIINVEMKKKLNKRMYRAYQLLYVDKISDKEAVKRLGSLGTKKKSDNSDHHILGYKQLANIRKKLLLTAKSILKTVDLY